VVNHAVAGRNLEWEVRHELEADGYSVIRSAGSKGAVDLIAIKAGQVLFVQVKRTTPPSPAAWNLLFDLAEMASAIPVLATARPKPITYQRITARKTAPPRRASALTVPFHTDLPGETTP
jgi:hypothetical protein